MIVIGGGNANNNNTCVGSHNYLSSENHNEARTQNRRINLCPIWITLLTLKVLVLFVTTTTNSNPMY